MAENLLYTAVYADVNDALDDLKAIEQLHKDEVIGKFDAAVIDQEDGKPHIAKRVDHTTKVVKRSLDASTDELSNELREALKS